MCEWHYRSIYSFRGISSLQRNIERIFFDKILINFSTFHWIIISFHFIFFSFSIFSLQNQKKNKNKQNEKSQIMTSNVWINLVCVILEKKEVQFMMNIFIYFVFFPTSKTNSKISYGLWMIVVPIFFLFFFFFLFNEIIHSISIHLLIKKW